MIQSEEVRQRLRNELPPGIFEPVPQRVWYAALNLATFAVALWLVKGASSTWVKVAFGAVAGHSVACLGAFAHDLTHGSVLRAGRLNHALQLVCWGLNMIAPAVWFRVHNRTHHSTAGTLGDPDRRFSLQQQSVERRLYSDLFYPSRDAGFFNPLCLLHFIPYISKHTLNALGVHTSLLPAPVPFSAPERRRVATELVVLLTGHACLWAWLGTLENILAGGILPVAVSSAVLMMYIFTQHFPLPLAETPDVLATTVSLRLPRLVDALHSNLSYHVEHHLFPRLSSKHFPIVSEWLTANCPQAYRRLGLIEAWQMVFTGARWTGSAPTAPAPVSEG